MNDIFFQVTFGLFGGTLAIIFFIIGIVVLRKTNRQKSNCTIKTYGKVVNNIRHKDRDTNGEIKDSWHALFEYNVDDVKCSKESTLGTRQPKYEIGQTVEIYYNPKNCHDFYVVGDTYPPIIGRILLGIGIITIIMVLFAIRP